MGGALRPDDGSTMTGGGVLRLACVPIPEADSLWNAPNLLMQKFPAPEFVATTSLELTAAAPGESAGLIIFGYDYAWLGLRNTSDGLRLVHVVCRNARDGGREKEIASVPVALSKIFLRASVNADATCRFAFSRDGKNFEPIGESFKATPSRWVGAKIGVFASAPPTAASKDSTSSSAKSGAALFDWFRVTASGNL